MEEKMPLVSVAVITFNSSKYVLETLESIKAQTYQNIELIISDDCSTDNTMQLCKIWCEQNKERFARIQYVEVEQNTGVSANCNRAEDACEAEWVKLIAGDDMLLPNCLTDFMEYVQTHEDVVYVFGKIELFDDIQKKIVYNDTWPNYSIFLLDSSKEQYDFFLRNGNCIPSASVFYNKNRSINLGIRCDERIPFIEDRPRWYQLFEQNVRLHFVGKYVVRYRVCHKESLSVGSTYSDRFYSSQRLIYYYYNFPKEYRENQLKCIENIVRHEILIYENYKSIVNSHAYRLGRFLLQPVYLIKKIMGINR